MNRKSIQKILRRYKLIKNISSVYKLPVDIYEGIGVHVLYSKENVCEAIEITGPAKPTLNGKSVLGQPFKVILGWFKEMDGKTKVEEDGITAKTLRIGVYIPDVKRRKQGRVESVIVFIAGYYDKDPA